MQCALRYHIVTEERCTGDGEEEIESQKRLHFQEFDKEKTVGDFSGCSFESVQIRVVGKTEVFTSEGGVFSGTGDVVHITEKGVYCRWTTGEQADGECHDYEVKLCCLQN